MSDSQEVVWEKDLAEKIEQETGESIVPVVATQNLAIARDPQEVLDEAMRAAKLLTSVINQKAHPVRFRGETYLEFEDWQTVGRFYGATVRIISTTFVTFGDVVGFEARAECVDQRTGNILSCAESMCLSDEDNWKNKPLFQLRSMAQTRSGSKAFRNVFSWVVVLAGYKPTPAEEMEGVFKEKVTRAEEATEDAVTYIANGASQTASGSNVTKVEFVAESKPDAAKPWKLYKATISGLTYGVFDDGLVDTLNSAMKDGKKVKIVSTRPGKKEGDIVLNRIEVVL